ncbi:MFS transporter [Streptomyces sp. NPDC048172]|uniref:MFS transporter n=1 Tax=Streptomyces sp. NPDC048172 TaxID=3365505 RepID=UPI003712186F
MRADRAPVPPLPPPWTAAPPPPPLPPPWTAPAPRRVGVPAAIALVGTFVAFLDATIVNIAVPDIVRSFPAARLSTVSWVLNAYNVVFAAFLVPAGSAADRWGVRRAFLVGLALFTAASAACGLAPSIGFLIGARLAQAAGSALLVPASLAVLLPLFPRERRTVAVTLFSAVAAVASGIGPSIGGALLDLAGWELAFWVNVPIGVAALAVAFSRVPRTPPPRTGGAPDLAGAAGAAATVGTLALAIVQGPEWGWADARVLGLFGATAALLAGVVRRTARHPSPVVDPALLRRPVPARANLVSLLFATAFFANVLCNVLFLTGVWHYGMLRAGFAVTPAPLAAAVTSVPAGRLADRFGPRSVVLPGAVCFAVGCALYATVLGGEPAFATRWLPVALLTGVGIGLVLPVLSGAALTGIPAERFATASGINSAARQIGAVLGTSLLVAVTGTPTGAEEAHRAYERGWWAAVCLAALSALCATALRDGRRPRDTAGEVG